MHIRKILSGPSWNDILTEDRSLLSVSKEDMLKAVSETIPGKVC